jgi:beta-phosphoglucomutase-like phosphatase (HAD superfamily)
MDINMPSPELVIFDCDGVLVDSEIIAARAEAEMLAKAGFEITAEDLARDYAGLTFKDILLRLEKEQGMVLQASLIEETEKLVDQKLAREVRAIEGAAGAVASVTASEMRLFEFDQREAAHHARAHRASALFRRCALFLGRDALRPAQAASRRVSACSSGYEGRPGP